jgi:hypothetical protein
MSKTERTDNIILPKKLEGLSCWSYALWKNYLPESDKFEFEIIECWVDDGRYSARGKTVIFGFTAKEAKQCIDMMADDAENTGVINRDWSKEQCLANQHPLSPSEIERYRRGTEIEIEIETNNLILPKEIKGDNDRFYALWKSYWGNDHFEFNLIEGRISDGKFWTDFGNIALVADSVEDIKKMLENRKDDVNTFGVINKYWSKKQFLAFRNHRCSSAAQPLQTI